MIAPSPAGSRLLAACAAATLVWALTPNARAEPRFAVRQGMRCAHCHINRTGGGMRTLYGATFGRTNLSTFRLPGTFNGRVGSGFAVGANLRLVNRTVFEATTSLDGMERRSESSNSFEITEGNVYLALEVLDKYLTLYIDETVTPEGASSREAFVLVQNLPLDLYIKAGRFLLPYPLRIPDDTAFIRQETGFTYANQDLGVEVGIAPHPFSLSVAVSNGSLGGSDPNEDKQVTTMATVVWPWGRAGVAFAWNDTSQGDDTLQTFTTGAHVGLRLGRLITLAELDWVRGVSDAETFDQLSMYVSVDYEVIKGLYLQFVFEGHDPLVSLSENERDRFVVGLSWFPIPFLEVRAHYRVNRDIPQRVSGNADELVVEVHGFL